MNRSAVAHRASTPRWLILLALTAAACANGPGSSDEDCIAAAGCRPNVLLIIVDDLRPELASYGRRHALSPNIDALAASGVRFDNAYVQIPVCGASRASLFSGLRPTHTRFTNFAARIDVDAPDVKSLPELFIENGYVALANGKVLHYPDDGLERWSAPPWRPDGPDDGNKVYALDENIRQFEETGRGPAYEAAEVGDSAYPGGQVVDRSIADLARFALTGEPFFLAVGLWKPHLPFNAPRRYWDLYDPQELPEPASPEPPLDAPDVALHDSLELRAQYTGIPPIGEPIPAALARTLRHAYLAALSYSDALIGRLLAALEELGMEKNTIVVLTGDNGFFLGEHTLWTKHANFDWALHVPLLIRAPGFSRGAHAAAVVEILDLYPTLADLAGLDRPAHLAGLSLEPLLRDANAPGKGWAVSQYHALTSHDPGPWFGESLRTDNWLYTEWRQPDGALRARMLYDHDDDPAENVNIAETVDPAIANELSERLRGVTGTPAS